MEIPKPGRLIDVRQRIVSFIKIRGPALPVHAAKDSGISMLFASAYLSELVSDKTLRISDLKVGGSPLYFLPGQEHMLESFYTHLPGKEKEAFLLLKERKVLRDDQQEPAIRVALRQIKDFALPIRFGDSVFWRFFTVQEQEVMKELQALQLTSPIKTKEPEFEELKIKIQEPAIVPENTIETHHAKPEGRKEVKIEQIFPEKEFREKKQSFFDLFKMFLNAKGIELIALEKQDKKEIIAKVRNNLSPEKIYLLFAYDTKRISEEQILKAHKKASSMKLEFSIFFKGDLNKKMQSTIEAYRAINQISKIQF